MHLRLLSALFIGLLLLVGDDSAQAGAGPGLTAFVSAGQVRPPEAAPSLQAKPVVRAVMFWSTTCPQCHRVLEDVLPPLREEYGDQLDIRLILLASEEDVELLFQCAAAFGLPREQVGVPFLIIGDTVLMGGLQIPEQLPGLIEKHLAAGGVDVPDLPGLRERVGLSPPPEAAATAPPLAEGFGLATTLLAGMTVVLGYTAVMTVRTCRGVPLRPPPTWQEFAIPLLALVGLGVAGYLAYVETQAVPAVCGPVGNCNAVQFSPYARLFGVIPMAILGIAGYLLILATWLYGRLPRVPLARHAGLLLFGMTLFGVLFSLYLTYLELFVIRAVCAWCLTSAVIMTLLMVLSVAPAFQTFAAQPKGKSKKRRRR